MAAYTLKQQIWVVATETVLSAKSNIFIICHLPEKGSRTADVILLLGVYYGETLTYAY